MNKKRKVITNKYLFFNFQVIGSFEIQEKMSDTELETDLEEEFEPRQKSKSTTPEKVANWMDKFIKSMYDQRFDRASCLLSSNPMKYIHPLIVDELHESLLDPNNYDDECFVELFTDIRLYYNLEFHRLYDMNLPNYAKRFLTRKTKPVNPLGLAINRHNTL